jgi:hypothetical protein
MKISTSLFIAALSVATFLSSCKNDPKVASGNAAETNALPSAPTTATEPMAAPDMALNPAATVMPPMPGAEGAAAAAKPVEPPQNAKGIWHYTCSKGCAGGAGSAAPCAKCGTVLAHNTKYHGDVPTPAPSTSVTSTPGQTATPPTPKPEPPQNAKGVWHYTCADGCAGGAGAISPCAKCSKPLAHNPVYHQ